VQIIITYLLPLIIKSYLQTQWTGYDQGITDVSIENNGNTSGYLMIVDDGMKFSDARSFHWAQKRNFTVKEKQFMIKEQTSKFS